MKRAQTKPKPCRSTGCASIPWHGHEELLPATFEWEAPALTPPTRRDATALPFLLGMDRTVRALHTASLETPGPIPDQLAMLSTALYERYQAWQEDQIQRNSLDVQCHAGCSTCCHQYPMGIHAYEILHLYLALKDRNDFKLLLDACRTRRTNYLEWLDFTLTAYPSPAWDDDDRQSLAQEHDFDDGQPCPFLDDAGLCSIHAVRPLTCRMFLSLSDPAYCTSELNTSEEARQILLPPEEAVTLRLWRLDRLLDSWGHDGSLYGSLLDLHAHLEKQP